MSAAILLASAGRTSLAAQGDRVVYFGGNCAERAASRNAAFTVLLRNRTAKQAEIDRGYAIGGSLYTRAQLDRLRKELADLDGEIAANRGAARTDVCAGGARPAAATTGGRAATTEVNDALTEACLLREVDRNASIEKALREAIRIETDITTATAADLTRLRSERFAVYERIRALKAQQEDRCATVPLDHISSGAPDAIDPSKEADSRAVETAITGFLDRAFAIRGEISVAIRIQRALSFATAERDTPGRSNDLVLRNAEYYLHGLYAASARDLSHALTTAGAGVYQTFKIAASYLRDEGYPWLAEQMQTTANPMSKPGGSEWAYKGLKAGFRIDGSREVREQPGHGLQLRLGEAVPRLP